MFYLKIISEQPAYIITIALGLLIGLTYYILTHKNEKDFKTNLFVFIVSSIASIMFSLVICSLISKAFFDKTEGYRSVFSIFYAVISFPCFVSLLQKTAKTKISLDCYTNAVLLSIAISRIACIIENCCMGTIGAAYIEIALTVALLLYNIIRKRLTYMSAFSIYFIWRFIADFFKDAYKIEKLGILTPVQYLSATAIIFTIIYLILQKRRNQDEK